MCDENERCCGCHSHSANPSVQQTLDELDFTRGIWTAALGGSYEEVLTCLEDKKTPVDLTDSSGYTALVGYWYQIVVDIYFSYVCHQLCNTCHIYSIALLQACNQTRFYGKG